MYNSSKSFILISCAICFFVLIAPIKHPEVDCASAAGPEALVKAKINITEREGYESSGLLLYREPTNLFQTILKEFFVDIDWRTISDAREQVEKFLRRLDTLWKTFKQSTSSRQSNSKSAPISDTKTKTTTTSTPTSNPVSEEEPRLFMSKLFGGSSTQSPTITSSQLPMDDQTNIKGMLDRVACFVGYMRLLTHTQSALNDLDASKVVTNLFASGSKDKSSSYFGNWFG